MPPDLIVLVSVAQWKVTDDFVCQTAFDNSIILAAAAAVAPWPFNLGLAIAAAAAQALAQGESAAANDPPEPSLAFDRIERFQPTVIGGPDIPETRNIRALLARGLRVTEARRVLSITEGRLEGARQAGTQDDVNRQMGYYRYVTATASTNLASLQELGAKADQEFDQILNKLRQTVQAQPETLQDLGNRDIIPGTRMAAGIPRALKVLSNRPEIAAEVFNDALDDLRKESAGTFGKLARGIAEAIGHIVNYDQQLVQTTRLSSH